MFAFGKEMDVSVSFLFTPKNRTLSAVLDNEKTKQ
jgi:hypothetical protein